MVLDGFLKNVYISIPIHRLRLKIIRTFSQHISEIDSVVHHVKVTSYTNMGRYNYISLYFFIGQGGDREQSSDIQGGDIHQGGDRKQGSARQGDNGQGSGRQGYENEQGNGRQGGNNAQGSGSQGGDNEQGSGNNGGGREHNLIRY